MLYEVSPENGFSDYFFTCHRRNDTCVPHAHSHIEFIIIREGRFSVSIEDQTYTLTAGTVVAVMPYQVHRYVSETDTIVFAIACPPEYISEYNENFRGKTFSPFYVPVDSVVNEIVSRIAVKDEQKHFLRPEKPEAYLYKALIYAVLASFVRQCSVIDTTEPEYDVYRKAMVYITKHYTEDISLQKVATACGITPPHLSRVLNSHGKYSFSDIVNSLRVFEAKRMLSQTKLPVSQIALEAGFGTIRNFNRAFQKHFLCTPRQFRDSNK